MTRLKNAIELSADIDQPAISDAPLVTQGDSIELTINVLKGGEPFSLDNVTQATLVVTRSDGEVIIDGGEILKETNQVRFNMRKSSTLTTGTTRFTVQIFDEEIERVSTMFGVYVVMEDASGRFEDLPEDEQTLIQEILGEGPAIVESMQTTVKALDQVLLNAKYIEPYDVTATYYINNIVSLNGNSYIAKRESTGQLPPDPEIAHENEYWGLLGRKGDSPTELVHTKEDVFIATEGQQLFELSHAYDMFQGRTTVLVDGVPQYPGENYLELSQNKISLVEGVPEGTKVTVKYFTKSLPLEGDIESQVQQHTAAISNVNDSLISVNQDLAQTTDDLIDRGLNSSYFPTIQEAIDNTPPNGLLIVPNNDYVVDTIIIDKPITIDFMESKLKSSDINQDVINILGTKSNVDYILSEPLARGQRTIKLTDSPTDINIGDVIVIQDDKRRIGDNTPGMNVETHVVEDIDYTNKTITLKGLLSWGKEISIISNVYKITPVENVTLKNLTIEIKEGSTYGRSIFADMTSKLRIYNYRTRQTAGSSIRVTHSIDFLIDDFDFCDPQVVESGQGYGVNIYAGVNRFTVKNGRGTRMRHTVDLHSSYNGVIENVTTESDASSSFVLSHNGWGGDVLVKNCHVKNGSQYGIHLSGQGVEPYEAYQMAHHNITIEDCTVQLKESSLDQYALYFPVPIVSTKINNVTCIYGDGETISNGNSGGIYLLSVDNSGVIENVSIKGFYWGVRSLSFSTGITQQYKDRMLSFINFKVKNASVAFSNENGLERNVKLKGLTVDTVSGSILRIIGGYLIKIMIEDIYSINSTAALWNQLPPTSVDGKVGAEGKVSNFVKVGMPRQPLNVVADKRLTLDEMYLYKKNNVIPISSSGNVTIAAYPLQDSMVEGQKLTLLNVGLSEITVPTSSKLISKEGTYKVLSPNASMQLSWVNGAWREIA